MKGQLLDNISQEGVQLLVEMLKAAVADLEGLRALYPSLLAEIQPSVVDSGALPVREFAADAATQQDGH